MELNNLTAISPVDGRYFEKTVVLQPLLSEFGLMKHRLNVEIQWFIALSEHELINEIEPFSIAVKDFLEALVTNFSLDDAKQIKEIETKTNHDVKAVEYFLKQQIRAIPELIPYSEFIHFACTSADINNLAYGLILKEVKTQILSPILEQFINTMKLLAHQYASCAMIGRTHGQAATPTTMGKEFANYVSRLNKCFTQFQNTIIEGKVNGAVGNFNAHHIAYPEVDWLSFSKDFVEHLGLQHNAYTTQIEAHDYVASLFNSLARINTVIIDFNRDMWAYISLGWFKLKTLKGEIGSSTMPHKVNPIQFENSEGNLLYANTILNFLADKLPTSRLQRDLVDSTLMRNIGMGIAHSLIAYKACLNGIEKLEINEEALLKELNNNWEVLGEAIQTIMRRYGIPEPYEKLKSLTRGKKVSAADIKEFVNSLELPDTAKTTLLALTPETYIGLAESLAKDIQ